MQATAAKASGPGKGPVPSSTVFCLGLAQLISWGVSYYLIGGFGGYIGNAQGWARDTVYGGFALGLLVMGLTSPITGRLIDRHGGRKVMMAGSILNAAGCAMLAFCHTLPVYYAAWLVLGLGMRLTLYDAAFAALARIGGPHARRPISQITLLGGLASTAFWPLGHYLAEQYGWRIALLVYAGCALATLPLHWAIPGGRHGEGPQAQAPVARAPLALRRADVLIGGGLYAMVATMANFLNAGMSAHMIGLLDGLGLGAAVSVWIATLRGVGQSGARLCEVLFGRRVEPLLLNLVACLLMPLAFVAGLYSGRADAAAIAFALLYGACNGILTITRGTVPLVLFDHRTYGGLVGRLLVPSFILSAAAPVVYAAVMDGWGLQWGLYLSLACTGLMLLAAVLLMARFGGRRSRIQGEG
ncbi:MFS transporter [Bordetella flabilis]|uniref:Transporter n=1 Tax=Bordetella flabilis TaxID=463014 RepID=A0A193GLN1_9BORD|nr:MFS transporter [Bordetella flabilis]ANN80311.1 transporter [Bordetella flabilis]